MPDYNILLTMEAICDITDITEYIDIRFGYANLLCGLSGTYLEMAEVILALSIFPTSLCIDHDFFSMSLRSSLLRR